MLFFDIFEPWLLYYKYIMCYVKPEEILKFVHNRNFKRHNN